MIFTKRTQTCGGVARDVRLSSSCLRSSYNGPRKVYTCEYQIKVAECHYTLILELLMVDMRG